MTTVKIRRVGNSNVISLPRHLEPLGFRQGASVVLVPTPHGELILLPAERIEGYIEAIGQRVVEENREAIQALGTRKLAEGVEAVDEPTLG